MSIKLGDNIQVQIPKPLDSKYLNDTIPYTGISQVNSCIASGLRSIGLTVNINEIEYWYKTGVTDTALVIKSAGGTWGSIGGVLSGQTDLQNALNAKLNISAFNTYSGTTVPNTYETISAINIYTGTTAPNTFLGINACAADSAKLNNKLPAYYLNTGSTAICATTAINSKALCGCVPASFLLSGGTAVDSLKLGGQLPAYYLNTGTTITCAADSAKLNNKLPSYYLNTGSTSINSLALCGCIPSCFLGVNACAVDSAKLNNQLPTYYLNTGSTALCATTAGNALALCSCTPACFLGVNACAADSAKLNNQLPAYYLNTGSTITCAADSAKLNNQLPAYYLNTGSTALCATCAIGAKNLCGCVPASFLLSGGTAVCATCAGNASTIAGCSPSCFLGVNACAADSAKLNNQLPVYYLNTGSTALCATTAGNALCLGGVLPAGYLLSGGTANNSLCLGGALANTYAPIVSPSFTTCITTPVIKVTSVTTKTSETAMAFFKSDGTILSGTSAGGGMTWTGSTANGVGTYVSATCIYSNPNMTFNGNTLTVTGNVISCGIGSGFDSYNDYKLSGNTILAIPTKYLTSANIGIGYQVLNHTIYTGTSCGCSNIGIGYQALSANTCGSDNIAIGTCTLFKNTCGTNNIAIGRCALFANTTGSRNVAITDTALIDNTTGTDNVAVGQSTLTHNICGINNVAIGTSALFGNTCGCINIAFGLAALFNNMSGCNNIGIGQHTLQDNTTGCNNVGIGICSLYNNSSGCNNFGIGNFTLLNNSTGCNNIAIGLCAGYSETGSDKLYIANTDTANPLIYGDFAAKCIKINGNLIITGNTTGSTSILSPIILGSTCVCSPIVCSSSCIITPKIYGGILNNSTIYIVGTTSATTTSSYVILQPAGGSVGIGTATPTTILTLRKPIDSVAYGSGTQMIDFKSYYTGYDTETVKASIYAGVSSIANQRTDNGYLAFMTACCGTLYERLRIEKDGNVGIGITCPASPLSVTKDGFNFGSNAYGVGYLTSANGQKGLYLGYDLDDTYNGVIASVSGPIGFWTANGATWGERLTILSTGNVGIGTASPQANLEVSKLGGAYIRITNSCATMTPECFVGSLEFWNNDADTPKVNSFVKSVARETFGRQGAMTFGVSTTINADAVEVARFSENGYLGIGCTAPAVALDVCGSIKASGCGTAVDWIGTSDCRLKKCIKPIIGALSTVMQLQGVSYELCDDEKHENQIGLIAQDVNNILPAIVSHSHPTEKDFKYGICDEKLGLKYSKLSAVLIEAIKEQQKQIEEQQKQITCLRYDLNYWKNYNIEKL